MLNEKELKTIQQFDLENNYPHCFWLDMVNYEWLDIVSQLSFLYARQCGKAIDARNTFGKWREVKMSLLTIYRVPRNPESDHRTIMITDRWRRKSFIIHY